MSPRLGLSRASLRALLLVLSAALAVGLAPAGALAHGNDLADEPVIPGIEWATDFQVAPNGDVYVAGHDGEIRRYARAGGTVAHPRYELTGERIWKFSVTKQNDRGLVGIALDSAFGSGQRYLYALLTRGSTPYIGQSPGQGRTTIRRTVHLVRIAIPSSGAPQASDLKVILGADAPADPDSSCRPFNVGQAGAVGETDALPNGVQTLSADIGGDGLAPNFTEDHVYPDGDLSTRDDGAYDCIASDGDSHGAGSVASAPDGSLFVSIGDSTLVSPPQNAALRTMNLESYAGKVLHIDRNGRGTASHPFCAGETDLTRVCTKIWALGLRNAFRISLLPPDGGSAGQPVVAVADVGNYSLERLTMAHPGDNLGWPCWEGTYFNYPYASPSSGTGLATLWGGPDLVPAGPGRTSCERKTLTGDGTGFPKPSADITWPTIEYQHEQDATPSSDDNGSAIIAGPRIEAKPGADPEVALPSEWTGSVIFGDYVRGWINRISPDPDDPGNADRDGGLRVPADEGRELPTVRTQYSGDLVPDPLLDRIAEPPVPLNGLPPYYRLTSRQGPDGSLWYLRYGAASQSGAIYRLRHAPAASAQIESVDGACATGTQTQQPITLTAQDAGAGATYAWDVDGDGVPEAGRTGRSTTLTATQLAALQGGPSWVRVFVTVGSSQSVATRYVCAGKTPTLSITSPADGAEIVLGEPTTITASRPAGDADLTGVPDSSLRWKAETIHGSSHTHLLSESSTPYEAVGGQQKMQFTIRPDSGHELGSYTAVRFYAPQADGNGVAPSIRLYPKPVTVRFESSPAGAPISMLRDGPSTVIKAPGDFQAAAGFATKISAPDRFTDDTGMVWWFQRWSDGATSLGRPWRVPASGGTAPVAQYAAEPPAVPPTTDPVPDPGPGQKPPAPEPQGETPAPGPGPLLPGGPTPPGVVPTPPRPALLPPTVLELATAKVQIDPVRNSRKKTTALKASIALGRRVDVGGLVVKVALRDARCRWWSFGRKRFVGRAVRSSARKRTTRCSSAPSWKRVSADWSGPKVVAQIKLKKSLRKGRYAVRIRVQVGRKRLAERVHAARVK